MVVLSAIEAHFSHKIVTNFKLLPIVKPMTDVMTKISISKIEYMTEQLIFSLVDLENVLFWWVVPQDKIIRMDIFFVSSYRHLITINACFRNERGIHLRNKEFLLNTWAFYSGFQLKHLLYLLLLVFRVTKM